MQDSLYPESPLRKGPINGKLQCLEELTNYTNMCLEELTNYTNMGLEELTD